MIHDVQPHVIVTFDPHGGYYHPDHLAVHRAATAAFFSSGGLDAAGHRAPPRLFYSTFAADVFREHAAANQRVGHRGRARSGRVCRQRADRRRRLRRAADHGPQARRFRGAPVRVWRIPDMLRNPPPEQAKRLHAFAPIMEQELFTLGAVRGPVPRWPLADVFDGIEVG